MSASSLPVAAIEAKPTSNSTRHTANFHPGIWGSYFLSNVPTSQDQSGNFNEKLVNDIQGVLNLYEATQLRLHGEEILEEAHTFTLIQLTKSLSTQLSPSLIAQVSHTLQQSFRKGMPRLEARYYISFYQEDPSYDEKLLTFAKLDFNILQDLHQKEVSNASKWWIEDLNVSTKLPFVRDRIVEAYFWILGTYFEPKYSLGRMMMVKMFGILTIIDDMYDAYGTFEELELFTNVVERWDICSLDDLPEYMKLCYTILLDGVEEIKQEIRNQGKVYHVEYVKKELKRLVHAYFYEARWFHCNYTPTIQEYMEVGTVTSGCAFFTTLSFLCMEDTTVEILKWAISNPKIIAATSFIGRVMDDISGDESEKERGHVASIVECYMKQHNTSRQDAIAELLKLVENSWKDINEACLNPTQVPLIFLMRTVNFARMMDVLYKDEDIINRNFDSGHPSEIGEYQVFPGRPVLT
ncbi:hypothetical protein Fmac_003784 [Flemingia macrophylla]|uniref:Sesquiterpene synthase n=1 Tax=Flemingia macrophylla TaxID=520843 RepID=A0ABD1N320_9FABA